MTDGLVGIRLNYSLSAVIHGALKLKNYKLIEVDKEDFDAFIGKKDFRFLNITSPYKERVIPFLDEIDEKAKLIGAVNTVINKEGRLYGYNTDYYGMEKAFSLKKINVKDKRVLILGSGGTSKTAQRLMKDLCAKEVYVCSRKGELNYDGCFDLAPEIIINTTPVGTYPNINESPIDLKKFKTKPQFVFDCVYNPVKTKLIRDSVKLGIPSSGGLSMLAYQAIFAERLMFKLSGEEIEKALIELYLNSSNIVLIGMGGAGKTRLGGIIAEMSGMTFYDTDKIIFNLCGKTPEQLFNEKGEAEFRKTERQAVEWVSAKKGCVIATGGGAVMDGKNAELLKCNGRLYYIKRSVRKLARKNRPLYTNLKAMMKIYKERSPVYLGLADKVVINEEDINQTAKEILKDFYETVTY